MGFLESCAHYFHELGRASYGYSLADRRYLAPAVASPNPFFHSCPIGQCCTNLACEFDQTIIFRPTTPPIKVWLARLGNVGADLSKSLQYIGIWKASLHAISLANNGKHSSLSSGGELEIHAIDVAS